MAVKPVTEGDTDGVRKSRPGTISPDATIVLVLCAPYIWIINDEHALLNRLGQPELIKHFR